MRKYLIAISGVPGVGKTRIASLLARNLGANLISVTDLVKLGKIRYSWDRKRKTKVLDVKNVRLAVAKSLLPGNNVVEGHLSHLTKPDVIFVLRCDPKILIKRLRSRKWAKPKVEENVQAEMLDIITAEALGERRKVYEIDTTNKTAVKTSAIILRILKSSAYRKKFKAGKIRWLQPSRLALT